MAKVKKLPVTDRTTWWSDLAYMPTEYKESRLYMAQSLFFAKQNSQVLQDKEKAIQYRKSDVLNLDRQTYINLIDPPTSRDAGGKADYFSADFKAFPIDVHLDNIMDAALRTIPFNITCTLTDPIAKLHEQKEKEKIIAQRIVRGIINGFAKELGLPPISESADPYKWIQNFTATDGKKVDEIGDTIDQIKTKIQTDDQLRLFQKYLYKNGLEIAFEVGIKHYFLERNEFQVKYSQDFTNDLKHFNKTSGRWAIDELTGLGEVKYIDPTTLYTSPFKDKNGDDILYFYHEEDVTFAEWEKRIGSDLDYEEKKKAIQMQKEQGWITGGGYAGTNSSNKNNSRVKIGFFSILTQEANAFAEDYVNDTVTVWDRKPLTWESDEKHGGRKSKVYNVWYSCYYQPLLATDYASNAPVDWDKQSHYIFHIRKDIDMMRYGPDKRYAKSSLVVWKNDKRASWTDIKEAFMPKIHTLWHKFQNCIVQDVQGLALDEDLLGGMLNAVDEANAKEPEGGTAIVNEWKMLRQAGMAWLKFRDKNGNMVVEDPSKLFIPIDSGHMKKGEMYLLQAMNLYNLLTQALAKGGASEALQPKARTPLGGIEIAADASSKATYFIEESYIEGVIVPYSMRCAHHIHTICKERKSYDYDIRWKQFKDIVGNHHGAVIEGIEDMNFENIGLTITNKDDSAKKELVIQTIVEKYATKQISTAALGLALSTDNWKLQLVELSMEEEKTQEQAQLMAEAEHNRQMELKQMELQIAQELTAAKGQAKNENIQIQGQVDAAIQAQMNQLKSQSMAMQKEQLLHNKLTENQQKSALKKDEKTNEVNLESQKELI